MTYTDTNLRDGNVECMTPVARASALRWHVIEGGLAAVNVAASGTPVAWLTGGAAAALGLGQIAYAWVSGIAGGFMGSGKMDRRMATNGLLNVIGGLTAQVPGLGTGFNSALLAMETVQGVNVAAGQPARD